MKVIIAGSRTICNIQDVYDAVQESGFSISEVVSGTAHGADRLGEQWAKNNHIPIKYFPADWAKYGRGAGFIRNVEMRDYAEALIAVWDGYSKGTAHMYNIFHKPKYIKTI